MPSLNWNAYSVQSVEGDLHCWGINHPSRPWNGIPMLELPFFLIDWEGSLHGRLTWQLNFKCLVAGETSLHWLLCTTLPDSTGLIHVVFDFVL